MGVGLSEGAFLQSKFDEATAIQCASAESALVMPRTCLQRLTEVCRANGGVYVKAGQFAAAFGAVPNEYRKHLALLQVRSCDSKQPICIPCESTLLLCCQQPGRLWMVVAGALYHGEFKAAIAANSACMTRRKPEVTEPGCGRSICFLGCLQDTHTHTYKPSAAAVNQNTCLQDKAKPRPFHVVDRVLRLELGAGAEEVFAEFSAEATAAASLAQVRAAHAGTAAVDGCFPGSGMHNHDMA